MKVLYGKRNWRMGKACLEELSNGGRRSNNVGEELVYGVI